MADKRELARMHGGGLQLSKAYTRLLTLAFLGSGFAPLVTIAASKYRTHYVKGQELSVIYDHPLLVLVALLVLMAGIAAYVMLRRLQSSIEQRSLEDAALDR